MAIQYRLGLFGFLSTEDEYAPGNYGMLDQVRTLLHITQFIMDKLLANDVLIRLRPYNG